MPPQYNSNCNNNDDPNIVYKINQIDKDVNISLHYRRSLTGKIAEWTTRRETGYKIDWALVDKHGKQVDIDLTKKGMMQDMTSKFGVDSSGYYGARGYGAPDMKHAYKINIPPNIPEDSLIVLDMNIDTKETKACWLEFETDDLIS